jgi:hypothetical protein
MPGGPASSSVGQSLGARGYSGLVPTLSAVQEPAFLM